MGVVITSISDASEKVLLIFACILFIEICFWIYIRKILHPRLCNNKYNVPEVANPLDVIKRLCDKVLFLHNSGEYTISAYLMGWCLGSKEVSDLKKDNIMSFLSWALFGKELADARLQKPLLKTLDDSYAILQTSFPEEMALIKDGFNKDLTHPRMCLTKDFPILHRPLLMYAIIKLLDLITNRIVLPWCGFTRKELNTLFMKETIAASEQTIMLAEASDDEGQKESDNHTITYWIREIAPSSGSGSDASKDKDNTVANNHNLTPYVYFHGITHGWWNYIPSVHALCTNRTVILMNLDNIKMGSLHTPLVNMKPKTYANAVHSILAKHSIDKVTLLGHSFGSFTASWFVKYFPEHVSHIILVDPVALLLVLPDVAVNFLYRNPKTFMEWLIYLFASREVTVANTMFRNFTWHSNILWLEDLPKQCSCTTVVCGKDDILHGKAIHAYGLDFSKQLDDIPEGFRRHAIYFPEQAHGDVMWVNDCLKEIGKSVKKTEEAMLLHSTATSISTSTSIAKEVTADSADTSTMLLVASKSSQNKEVISVGVGVAVGEDNRI